MKILVLISIFLFPIFSYSQAEVELTDEGVIFPRYTTAQRNILTPVKGQVIYNTTSNGLNIYDGSVWMSYQGPTPWITSTSNNGSNIHYSSGRVGINVSNPTQQFHVVSDGTTNNMVRLDGGITPSGRDIIEIIVDASTPDDAQFIEMQKGSSIVAAIDTDGSAKFSSLGVNGNPTAKLEIYQGNQNVGSGLRFDDGTANSDWDITHGFALRFHYGGSLRGFINSTTGAYTASSDRRLKKNISNLYPVLSRLEQLRPSTYTFKTDETNTQAIGLIAQDVKKVFPELVGYSEADDIYGVDYSGFSVVTLKAIQEQQKIIESLIKRIDALEAEK